MEEVGRLPISQINIKCNPVIILGPKAVGNENDLLAWRKRIPFPLHVQLPNYSEEQMHNVDV